MVRDIERELALILIENVESKRMNLTYKEVADELSKRLGRKINSHFGLTRPLETVARICSELNLPLITVRVIRAGGTSTKMAGEGFYRIANELKPSYKNWTEVDAWTNENKLVRACNEWDKLRTFVNNPQE